MEITINLKAQPELMALAAELTSFLGTMRTAMTTDPETVGEAVRTAMAMDPAAVGEAARAGVLAGAAMHAAAHQDAQPAAAVEATSARELADEDCPDVGAEEEPAAVTEPAPEPEPTEKEKSPDAAPKDGAASESQKTLADDPAAASALIQELSHLFLEAKSRGFAEAGSTWLPKFLESMGFKSHLEIPVGHVDFILMNARQALGLMEEK